MAYGVIEWQRKLSRVKKWHGAVIMAISAVAKASISAAKYEIISENGAWQYQHRHGGWRQHGKSKNKIAWRMAAWRGAAS